ncbi:hemerythrin domain-containing protein [Pasteurellaceae bacterium LIM206]|nr:hemerythrin domain-containing protein [Pasteurellaceae bacterium LIM206]
MINLTPQESATWEQPIEMLFACHGRVKRFCRQLRILPEYLQKNGVNQAVKNDVRQIITYFNVAAPLHHEDEEKDFFPLLLKYAPQAQADIETLERQHESLHENWAKLCVQLEELLADQRGEISLELITAFTRGYDMHIPLEEPLFQMGKELIPTEALRPIGKKMAQRRKA